MSNGVLYSDSSLSTVAQQGLDALTAGRTHKETVLFKGNLTLDARVNIPSYTKVVIEGRITLAASTNVSAMFRNKNFDSAVDSHIEICGGGMLDGNRTNSATGHCIQLHGVTDISVHDLEVHRAGGGSGRGIYITGDEDFNSARIAVYNIISDNTQVSNIEIAGDILGATVAAGRIEGVIVQNIIGTNSVLGRTVVFTNVHGGLMNGISSSGNGHRGVDLSYESQDCVLTNLYIENCALDGIAIATSPGTAPGWRNVVSNFVVINAGERGVNFSPGECSFTNGYIINCGLDGLRCDGDDATITNVICRNNSQDDPGVYSGMDIRGERVTIDGCRCYDDQDTQTQKYGIALAVGSADCHVYGNYVTDNLVAGIIDVGTDNIIHDNPGFTDVVAAGTTSTNPQIFSLTGAEIADLGVASSVTSQYCFAGDATDSVGNNDLTANGTPTYTTGRFGQAISLNGSTQYLQASANTVFDVTTQDFSYTGWFYRTTDPGVEQDIVRKLAGGSTAAGYALVIDSTDRLTAIFNDGAGGSTVTAPIVGSATEVNTIYFFGVSHDRDGLMTLRRYDTSGAKRTATVDISGRQTSATTTQTFTLGRASSGNSSFLAAWLDDIRFYNNTVLSEDDMDEIASVALGNLYYCNTTGSGYTANEYYKLNAENVQPLTSL